VTHAAGVMRVVLWTLGALERACVCGHVTMHSLHLSSCRTSASKLLRDRVPLLLECVCAVSLCTCACHCIHFQMPITAFTQQQCMCEGRSARKKCQKKKGGACPYARGALGQALYLSPICPYLTCIPFGVQYVTRTIPISIASNVSGITTRRQAHSTGKVRR